MITLDDYFVGRDKDSRYAGLVTHELIANAQQTVIRANRMLSEFYAELPAARRRKVSSGWRPPKVNEALQKIGAAPNSPHITCDAVDIEDFDAPDDGDDANDLAVWCLNNVGILESSGLWMEDPRCTPSWVHWQTRPPKSGRRFFIPDKNWANRLAGRPLTTASLEKA